MLIPLILKMVRVLKFTLPTREMQPQNIQSDTCQHAWQEKDASENNKFEIYFVKSSSCVPDVEIRSQDVTFRYAMILNARRTSVLVKVWQKGFRYDGCERMHVLEKTTCSWHLTKRLVQHNSGGAAVEKRTEIGDFRHKCKRFKNGKFEISPDIFSIW